MDKKQIKHRRKLTTDLKTTGDALGILNAATDYAMKRNIFRDKTDTDVLKQAQKMVRHYTQFEEFKRANYHKVLIEYINDKGQTILNNFELKPDATGDIFNVNITTFTIPTIAENEQQKQIRFFMFYNGDTIELFSNDQVFLINNTIVCPILQNRTK